MEKPRILGLAIGISRTGVALSDENRLLSSPYVVIEAKGKKKWLREIARVVKTSEAGAIVVGLPLAEDETALKIKKYIALLRERFTCPVVEWIDLFSTVQAERTFLSAKLSQHKRKQVIDKAPAAIILQSYLDSLRITSKEK